MNEAGMNIEALERTAQIIESQQPDIFNLASFLGANIEDEEGNKENCDIESAQASAVFKKAEALWAMFEADGCLEHIPHACGATACATGFAGLNKWFRDRGFKTGLDGLVTYTTSYNDCEGNPYEYEWGGFRAIEQFSDRKSVV